MCLLVDRVAIGRADGVIQKGGYLTQVCRRLSSTLIQKLAAKITRIFNKSICTSVLLSTANGSIMNT